MSVPVISFLRKFNYNGDPKELLYLKPKAASYQLYTEEDLAAEIQETSSLSVGDVTHTLGIVMTEMRKVLRRGDRVRLDGLGTFYMTLSCVGVETESELDVRNIKHVNIRFLPDKALKLVNNAYATTRSENNVSFNIVKATATSVGTTPDPDGEDDENYVDPDA